MSKLASTLHDATHQVPGVPAHHENVPHQHANAPSRKKADDPRVARQHQTPEHHQRAPRVLVAWQNWIGRHVGRA
jgi:hypothetical protein